MVRRHAIFLAILIAGLIGIFSLGTRVSEAQQNGDASCPALVELALSQLGNNCGNLDRNSACYGFNQVNSTFTEDVSTGFFSKPADRAGLATMKTINSAPLDLQKQQWGIAVLNVQANVPDTLPGQAVTFLLMGDTQVENAVEPSQGGDNAGVTIITQTDTNLRSAADTGSSVVGSLTAGTVLQATALSTDGKSVEVSTSNGTGWIDVTAVNPNPQLATLATSSGNNSSPMQAFYFRTGPGQTTCTQTPSVLAIQSPENIKVDLTANGADIRLGSLITLQVLDDGKTMKLVTLEGDAVLGPNGPNPVDVPAGFTTTRCLAAPQSLGLDGQANDQIVGPDCPWTQVLPAVQDDLDQGQIVQAALERLNLSRTSTSTPEVTPTPQPVACPVGTTVVHVVTAGETLFGIGLAYNTSVGAIMQVNKIASPEVIFTGQRLSIPCGLQVPIPPQQSTPGTTVAGVNCQPFRATSPLDGFSYGTNTFYWDAAPGADSYRVNVYSVDQTPGALVGSFTTDGSHTNLSADLTIPKIGYGFYFAWEVQALINGQVACTSVRSSIPRAPQPPATGNSFNVRWACNPLSMGQVNITYSNLPSGTTSVTITYNWSASGPPFPASGFTVAVPPDPGTATINGSMITTYSNTVVTANPSNVAVGLPGSITC